MTFQDQIREQEEIKEKAIKEFSTMSAEQQDFLMKVNKIKNLNKYIYIGTYMSIYDRINKLFFNYKEYSYIIFKYKYQGFHIDLEYIYEHIDSLKPIIEQKELKEIISNSESKNKKRGRL